uniref:t-SNARE coiled-coil homology domain-containing protein n=1 Tax=Corethron hystrix TaxID=216773 RepID=A0A7S1BK55_9STRA|mmetsp:Transcript_2936/g.5513  ORF Transcript_2936/g.5513 Transcript_2936/m.5513 type:complete len:322 (+) Transcript_2936:110-1075(+)
MGKGKVIDKELNDVLRVLHEIQKDVGGVEDARKRAEKRARQAASAAKSGAKGSKFLALKSDIIDHVQDIRALQEKEGLMEAASGVNPKAVIQIQHEVRQHLKDLDDEWKQLDGMYRTEVNKRRSKFTTEELEMQQQMIFQLQREIYQLREAERGAFAAASSSAAPAINAKSIESVIGGGSNVGGKSPLWQAAAGQERNRIEGGGGGQVEMTSYQQQQLDQIQMRDNEFDKDIEQIGEGIKDLQEIALAANEEVNRQNVMIDSLGNRIDGVQERVISVNQRMKETLRSVGGRGSKLCVDIMCVMLSVVIGLVLLSMILNKRD